jgi:hypothetical protein
MTYIGPDESEPTEQTREIMEVLRDQPKPIDPQEEWDRWSMEMQATVDKLVSDSRTLKLATAAIGCGCLMALGVAAMTSKAMANMMGMMKQLGDNQVEIANALGWQVKAEEEVKTEINIPPPVAQPKIEDVKLVDVDLDAVIGKPFEGPATEASEATKAQLKKDKEAGIIDQFKGQLGEDLDAGSDA